MSSTRADVRSEPAGPPPSVRLKICLAGSGGGHVRQLLDLRPAWEAHDSFFLTEETALGQSIAKERRTRFVPHFALGQARLGAPIKMLAAAMRSVLRSAAHILTERPDVVISTGAGAVFPAVLWGRLLGARIVVVESFARFDEPSKFARLAAPLAHDLIVQSAALVSHFPRAKVFDPLRILNVERPPKKPLLFATVGATLPFERLVDTVGSLKAAGRIEHEVVIQTGVGGTAPAGVATYETLPFQEMQALSRDADIVVCHGGTGSLITALRHSCHVIAMPRLFERGEHYDDHQAEITRAFEARGLIQVANTPEELDEAIRRTAERQVVAATTDPSGLIDHLNGILAAVAGSKRRSSRRMDQVRSPGV